MKVQNPIIGRASGLCGGLVFSTLHGSNIVKSKPPSRPNDPSAAQELVQAKLVAAVAFIKTVIAFFMVTGWSSVLRMPVFSYISGYFITNGISGTLGNLSFDYSKLVPCPDALGFSNSLDIVKSVADEVSVTWDKDLTNDIADADLITILLIDTADGSLHMDLEGVALSAENKTFSVPGTNSGNTYAAYVKPKKKRVHYKAGAELGNAVK